MGQKVHPLILRIGFIRTWHSRWFAKSKEYPRSIEQDYRIRKYIKKEFKHAAISRIEIERITDRIRIWIRTARPGIIIGRHGADIERLRGYLNDITKKEVVIEVLEVSSPAQDAQLVGENIALQIEKRVAYRRAVKRSIEQAMNSGAKGIRIKVAGRLGGAEMSRKETFKQGKVPLQTLRADLDYGFAEAFTTYGLIGVKVWIYKGDILGRPVLQNFSKQQPQQGIKI